MDGEGGNKMNCKLGVLLGEVEMEAYCCKGKDQSGRKLLIEFLKKQS